MAISKLNFCSRDKVILVGSIGLLILSLLDGALTLWGLSLGAIEEANPVMLGVIKKSPFVFMVVKLSLPVMLGFVLWGIRNTSRKLVIYGLRLVLIVYSVVIGQHVWWIINS